MPNDDVLNDDAVNDDAVNDDARAPARILVAGVGNIFLGDDGFGPEVARRFSADAVAGLPGVRVVDYGIRGMHLVYDLLEGVDALVLVDAIPPGSPAAQPGSIRVLEIRPEDVDGRLAGRALTVPDAHGMDPVAALGGLRGFGAELPLTYLVGCVVAHTEEGIGLSHAVAAAIPEAISAVRALLSNHIPARR